MADTPRIPIPKTHDQWGTPPEAAACIVDFFASHLATALNQDPKLRILEPSCGDGVFLRALLNAGFSAPRLLGIESDGDLAERAGLNCPGVEIWRADFLTQSHPPGARYMALGNPPFGGTQALLHTARLKEVCDWFAILCPAGLLEPCENRGNWRQGLRGVYPLYLRRFRDLQGDERGAGQRPSFVYRFCRSGAGLWAAGTAELNYQLSDQYEETKTKGG